MKQAMLAVACLVCLGIASPARAADDSFVKFDGGIGVIPVSNVTVNTDGSITVARNIVRGVTPPGQIWVIDALKAEVSTDGGIKVRGRGLLLGGGNNVGFNANQKVFATLICSAAAPFTQFSSAAAGVALAPNGDFRIDDTLSGPLPDTCASPVLLIRNTGGAWFAAGILKLDDDQ
jgi:hypothetical protein